MKKKRIFLLSLLLALPLILTACSSSQSSEALPKPDKILSIAQNTEISSMQASWVQSNKQQQVLQNATVFFQKKPMVIHGDFNTTDNNYKMWMNEKNNYIQSQGTSSKRWFKTEVSKNSKYSELTDALASSALMAFSKKAAKSFNVKKTSTGFTLTFNGNSKKMWNEVISNTLLASFIGIDQDAVKPENVKIIVTTTDDYDLKKLEIDAEYQENDQVKNLKLIINQINRLPKMQIPSNVTKSAVDLGSQAH